MQAIAAWILNVLVKGALVNVGAMLMSFVGESLLKFILDLVDELFMTLIEILKKRAAATGEDKSDDRRVAMLESWFVDYRAYRKKYEESKKK